MCLQQESDPLIVQIVAGSEMVVLVGYEIHIGETVGSMNFCIPLMVLNPVLDQISQQAHYSRRVSAELSKNHDECDYEDGDEGAGAVGCGVGGHVNHGA